MVKVNNFTKNIGKLSVDRFDFEKHINGDLLNHDAGVIKLVPTLNINNIEVDNLRTSIEQLNNQIMNNLNIHSATVGNQNLNRGKIKISGDIYGVYDNISVVGLGGSPLGSFSLGTLSIDNVLMWDGYAWSPSPSYPKGAAGGDLQGNYPNPQVKDLTMSGELIGGLLIRNSTNWVSLNPGATSNILISSSAGNPPVYASKNVYSPTGPAGGDLSGTYPNPTIIDNSMPLSKFANISANTLVASTPNSTSINAYPFGYGIKYFNNSLCITKSHIMCLEDHFLTDNFTIYKRTILLGGSTLFTSAGSSTEFSSVLVISSTTAFSGAFIRTQNTLRLSGNESFVCKFKVAVSASVSNFVGFHNNEISSITRGLGLLVSATGTLSFRCYQASGNTFVSGTTSFSNGVYYIVEIITYPNLTGAICKIYNSTTGDVIEMIQINVNINLFADELYSGIVSQITAGSISTTLGTYDYICTTKYLA